MNKISPTFTGFFLENLIYEAMLTEEQIAEINKNTNIDDWSTMNLHVENNSVMLTDGNKEVLKIICLKANNEKDYIWKLFVRSIKQFIGNRFSIDNFDDILAFKEFLEFKYNYDCVKNYIKEIRECTWVQRIREKRGISVEHSVVLAGFLEKNSEMNSGIENEMSNEVKCEVKCEKYLSGEIDLLFGNTIIDIKAYKNDTPDVWFAQTYLYKLMWENANPGKTINHINVVNLLNNRIYTYKW